MIGKQYSGKLNVRFDEGELEIEPRLLRQFPTLPLLHTLTVDGLEKGLVILCIPKDRFPSSSAVQDVIPGIGQFDSKRPRHGLTLFKKLI